MLSPRGVWTCGSAGIPQPGHMACPVFMRDGHMSVPNCQVPFESALALSEVALVGLGDWASGACFLSRYRNNQLVQAWTVCKYPSVYRTKKKKREGNQPTSIKLFLGSRYDGWCFPRLFTFRYYPFRFGKS